MATTAAPANAAPAETPTTALGRMANRMKPTRPTLYVLGVLLLVAAAVGTIALIAWGILSSRTDYFQQRNLRELDRIATELSTTRESLRSVATLHFVPDQLNFSLSPQLECLVANLEIDAARRQPISLTYSFTDPAGTREVARSFAPETPQLPPSEPGQAEAPEVPAWLTRICGYERPLGLAPDERVTLEGGRLQVERTVPLTDLLGPMTARVPDLPRTRPVPACAIERGAAAGPVTREQLNGNILDCFFLAARRDMQRDETYSFRPPDQVDAAVRQSLEAAFRSNAVRITASTPIEMLDLDSALENFDAVQILAPSKGQPLVQIGRVPAAIEGQDDDQTRLINSLLGIRAPAASQRPAQQTSGGEHFLTESRVIRTSDLVLFVRTTPGLAGLDCNPCRIVGIVSRAKFDQSVRRIDGVQATIFLIGVVTLIGLIPLIQLRLRKRLDATGRPGQYLLWFSLTLLAASAAIASLAIWSSAASRNVGADEAEAVIRQLRNGFNAELISTLDLVGEIGSVLETGESVFPAPDTLPTYADLTRNWNFASPNAEAPAVRSLANAWYIHPDAAIIDTVSFIRGDGSTDRETARISTGRFPAFGTSLLNRDYFNRARHRDYWSIPPRVCGTDTPSEFVLDRVFARPDGAPRTVLLLPATDPRLQPPDSGAGGSTIKADQGGVYDPGSRQYLVASGTLRTFLGVSLRPGFRYAVIDPNRRRDAPNVLFHSRPNAEFVENFEQELDDRSGFQTLVQQALARDDGACASKLSDVDFSRSRLDTNYRAQPVRLTVARLNPSVDWVLVIIEDRNDAGYAVWRAATFGYTIWLIGAVIAALAMLVAYLYSPGATDRNPGLSFWPRDRMDCFTPPRLDRHKGMRSRLKQAALFRDRHAWWVLGGGLLGIFAAEGASRILFAFSAAITMLCARAYFRGETTNDDRAARRFDRRLVVTAWILLALTVVLFVYELGMEYRFRWISERGPEDVNLNWQQVFSSGTWVVLVLSIALRSLIFSIAWTMLALCVFAARGQALERAGDEDWAHNEPAARAAEPNDEAAPSRWRRFRDRVRGRWHAIVDELQNWPLPETPAEPCPSEGIWRKNLHRLRTFRSKQMTDAAWIVALLVLGALAATAGFLDSYDQDRLLLDQRAQQVAEEQRDARAVAIQSLDRVRLAKLPSNLITNVTDHATATGVQAEPTRTDPQRPSCNSLSCLAIDFLDLEEQALEYSDFAPYRMLEGFDLTGKWSRTIFLLIGVAIPTIVLFIVFVYFRRVYFRRPPSLSPGRDPDFKPPLAVTRDEFVANALIPAARPAPRGLLDKARSVTRRSKARPPILAGGNHHLILGAGVDLQDELIPNTRRPLRTLAGTDWIDLLDPPRPVRRGARAVIALNLDLALQVPDKRATIRRTYDAVRSLIAWADEAPGERQLFLLADIDPLDRVKLLWEQQCRDAPRGSVEAWQWAELIQDFALVPVQSREEGSIPDEPGKTRMARAIREELAVLDCQAANDVRNDLETLMAATLKDKRRANDPDEVEKVIAYIAERMSDHYHKLWAGSSDEQRVMLYRLARGCHLKMKDSPALRSLLARGLLIRVPEYELINRSFARYVERVGAPSEISSSAARVGGIDWVWPIIRYPLIAIAGSAVILLQFVAPSGASGAVGALPALLALVPTLIGRWFQDRAAAT